MFDLTVPMKNFLPLEIVESLAHALELKINVLELRRQYRTVDACDPNNLKSMVDQVLEVARFIDLALLTNQLTEDELLKLLREGVVPAVVFIGEADPWPLLIESLRFGIVEGYRIEGDGRREGVKLTIRQFIEQLHIPSAATSNGKPTRFLVLTPLHVQPVASPPNTVGDNRPMTPVRRLWRLLKSDQHIIWHIYVYAVVVGILSLTLPLAVQAIIGIIAGGTLFQPVFLLIGFVVLATIASGVLQIQQMRIIEKLEQRLFTRASFEFAFRLPRMRIESLTKHYVPELVNRFFDVLTVQKGYSKILTDILTSALQILFGLVLLAFYHPFFVFFAVLLIFLLGLMFYFTGNKGLQTSIYESKYKYKIVEWLEEVARVLPTFKLAGFTNLTIEKNDYHLSYYLEKRQLHFGILVTQYTGIVVFKVAITAGVLIIGSLLVIDGQISLGQFVATEIVILTVMAAIEKMILSLDTIYDVLTAVDKISHVTDLPLDPMGGLAINSPNETRGFAIRARNLSYKHPEGLSAALNDINLDIASGERVGIVGPCGAGKTTLVNVLTGLYTSYTGTIVYDRFSLREINLTSLRDEIGDNMNSIDIFAGTIEENISMGKGDISTNDVHLAIEQVGLTDYVQSLPQGIGTPVLAGGKGLPSTIVRKLVLARTVAERPRLMVLDNFFLNLTRREIEELTRFLFSREQPWTLLCVSRNPFVLSQCDRILMMNQGRIVREGTFQELRHDPDFLEQLPHDTLSVAS